LKEHAILLVGELRLAKENQFLLKELAHSYDVFVVTERKFKSSLQYLGSPVDVLFVEDVIGTELHDQFYIQDLGIPQALQMHKAYLAFERLRAFESIRGKKYKTVYKIRSDWDMDFPLDLGIFQKADSQDQFIFMQSDMFYGGGRVIADIWSRFYFHILPFYFDRLDEYWPMKCSDLSDCDLQFTALHRLPFPSEVVGSPSTRTELEKVLRERWNEIKDYKHRNIKFTRLLSLDIKFPCEAAFLHFILNSGLKCKNLLEKRIPLDPFRFYDVDSICFEIKNRNFSTSAHKILSLSSPYKLDIPQVFVVKLKGRGLINHEQFQQLNNSLVPLLKNAGYKVDRLEKWI